MPSPMDSLASLSLNADDPNGLVAARRKKEQALFNMKRSLELQAGDPKHTFSGATNADVANEESDLTDSPNFGDAEQARLKGITDTNDEMANYNRPDVTAQRQGDFANKLALATMPNVAAAEAQGKNAIALEQEKARSERGAREDTTKANEALLQTMGMGGGAPGAAPGGSGVTMRPSFNAKGQMTLSGVPKPPQQISQEHGAQVGLSELPTLRNIVGTLEKHGALGPVMGRFGSAATTTGLDSLFMAPEAARAFSDFKSQLSLAKSNMAMVHGGARGGSNAAMATRFDQLLNPNQTPAALRGGIDTFERWLTKYANAQNSAELDAADAEFGIAPGGGTAPKTDLGADWGR